MIYCYCNISVKKFILEGLSIILDFNYFYINGICIHQIKGTTMGTKFAVAGSNLVVTYEEVKMFFFFYQNDIHILANNIYNIKTIKIKETFKKT